MSELTRESCHSELQSGYVREGDLFLEVSYEPLRFFRFCSNRKSLRSVLVSLPQDGADHVKMVKEVTLCEE